MRRFLAEIRSTSDDARLCTDWQADLSPALLSALRAAGILRPGGLADYYPCPGTCGGARRIEETGYRDKPWVGVCTSEQPLECRDELLTDTQLETYVRSFDRFVGLVRSALVVGEPTLLPQRDFASTYLIGTTSSTGRVTDVFLTLAAASPDFRFFLRQQLGATRPSLVLSPTSKDVAIEMAAEYGPGQHVQLVYVEDVLTLDNDAIVVRSDWRKAHAAVASVASGAAHVARLYSDSAAPVLVTAVEVAALCVRRREFDLFIDGVNVQGEEQATASYMATIRARNHGLRTVALTENGAAALIELVASGKPMQARELLVFNGLPAGTEIVERARRALEARRPWRWFHTRRGFTSDANTYVFAPPPGLRYAVLAPLEPARVDRRKSAARTTSTSEPDPKRRRS